MVGGVWCGAVWAEVDQCRKQRYKLGIFFSKQQATRKRESVIMSSHRIAADVPLCGSVAQTWRSSG